METPLPKQRNGRIVAVSPQEAGSAKTKTSINLGEACARCGLKILIEDVDGQGNASTSGS
jgi:chromosome partitioning protein